VVRRTKIIGISVEPELFLKLESKRGDLPKSYFYGKLLEKGLQLSSMETKTH